MSNHINEEKKDDKKISGERLREAIKIFEYIQPYKWNLFFGLVLLFFSSMVFMIFPYLSGEMVDIAIGESKTGFTLRDVAWVLVIVLIAQGFVSFMRIKLFATVSEKGIAAVRKALYEKLITLPIVFFEKTRSGELVSRLTADVEQLYNAFSITIAEFLRQVIILVAGILFLAFTTPQLALIMLAIFPIIVVGAMFFGRYIRKLSKQRQKELADSNIVLNETVQTIHVVKAFTNELFENKRYGKTIDQTVQIALKFANARAIFSTFIVTVLFGSLFFIIWKGADMLQNGDLTAGELISFVVYTAVIGGAIAGLGNFYTQLLSAIGATERVREILAEESEVKVPKQPIVLERDERFFGNISFENVQFTYPTRTDVQVLKDISFKVRAGQKVALVGPSGAGKSTIVQLLLKYYPISGGNITVDGNDIFEYDTASFRRNVAIVPQEVILFGGTIRENLLYGRPGATEDEVIAAAEKANAWEFIKGFPEGLDTIVGERGIKLSGGQRQRIAIARAILKDPAILLLDEATSSLDAESEKVVQEALDKLMEGRTSIIIAHRLSTIREVDTIFVIDKGQIVEQGTHDELSEQEDGLYNSLAKLQFEPV